MESNRVTSVALSVGLGLLGLAASAQLNQITAQEAPVEKPKEGVVVLSATRGNDVDGVLLLTERGGAVHVRGEMSGLKPGKHGIHIHEFGDLRDPEGKSAGGHFNPGGSRHGSPQDADHHAGDLGNIEADQNGVASVDKEINGVRLHYVIGRALVVHADDDDFQSQPSGDAGARVALGVIGFAEVSPSATADRPVGRQGN